MLHLFASLLLLVAPATAKPDPFAGTWVLNVAKSKYDPGPAPRSQTVTYTVIKGGLSVVATGVDPQGNPTRIEYTASFNGKAMPVTGNPDYDTVISKRVGPSRINFTRKKAGKTVQTGSMVVARDGKTRTVTINGSDASGRKIHNVIVYNRG